MGPHHNIMTSTGGGQPVLSTPGQQQHIQGMALVNAPPLTSHLPILAQSPGKNQEQLFLDTSNRKSAMFPIQILTSFNNAAVGGAMVQGANGSEAILNSALLTDGACPDLYEGQLGSAKNYLSFKHAQSFQQQKTNLMLKLQQQSTQNQSDNDNVDMLGKSLKNLEGIPSGTLNLGNTQGTQASNFFGMNLYTMGGALITNHEGQILGTNSITKMGEIGE